MATARQSCRGVGHTAPFRLDADAPPWGVKYQTLKLSGSMEGTESSVAAKRYCRHTGARNEAVKNYENYLEGIAAYAWPTGGPRPRSRPDRIGSSAKIVLHARGVGSTAATLWLATGKNPEWITRQMGHATTEMVFRIYSRYVPNMTRKDGSAFEALLKRGSDR